VHDPRRHFDLLERRQRQDALADLLPQVAAPDHRRIEVHLQRTDSRRQIDDPREFLLLQPFVNHMRLEAQLEVEVMRTEFDQDVAVAGAPDNDGVVAFAETVQDGRWQMEDVGCWIRKILDVAVEESRHREALVAGPGVVDGDEGDAVARAELAKLPQLGIDHHHRADEAAEARTVGAEDDRHVAGEIDRADRIGVVVQIRRMKPRLAAVGTCPFRLRADQADAGAGGVVVDFPSGREEGLDVPRRGRNRERHAGRRGRRSSSRALRRRDTPVPTPSRQKCRDSLFPRHPPEEEPSQTVRRIFPA
jgi:hypothetical protein